MPLLRRARFLASWVLACFVLSLGVAIASPILKPEAMQLVCTSVGAIKIVVQSDDGTWDRGAAGQADCPVCVLTGAPPPAILAVERPPAAQPLGVAVQPIPAARIAAATVAPLPARGPPARS